MSADILLNEIISSYYDELYDDAITYCNKFLRLYSEHEKLAGVYLTRALSYYSVNNLSNASVDLDQCIALVSDDVMLLALNGACKFELQLYKEALELFRLSLEQYNIQEKVEYNISQDFKDYLLEQIEITAKLSQEIKKNEDLEKKIEITEEFNNRAKEYQRLRAGFFILTITLPATLVFLNMDSRYTNFFNNTDEVINLFLRSLPWAFLEIFFLSQYNRITKLHDYYLHKLTVGRSIEKLRMEYFNQDTKEGMEDFKKFALQQYEKLYEAPSFIEKQALFVKYDKNKLKFESDISEHKKN
jgi:tetratricopeptide (TPR) repeat protein